MNLLEARAKLEELANGAYCDISVSIRGGKSEYGDIAVYSVVTVHLDGHGGYETQISIQDALDVMTARVTGTGPEDIAATVTPFDTVEF